MQRCFNEEGGEFRGCRTALIGSFAGERSVRSLVKCRWLALGMLLLAWGGQAQTGTLHEYELKAGVLYHILEYVEWPAASMTNGSSSIQIGLLGQIPFAEALGVLDGKTLQGRKLVIRSLSSPAEAVDCQVLFIGASEKTRLAEIVGELKKQPVLTVGEVEGFAANGGMINLIAEQNRIVMEINRDVAGAAHLNISSQLLKLARVLRK